MIGSFTPLTHSLPPAWDWVHVTDGRVIRKARLVPTTYGHTWEMDDVIRVIAWTNLILPNQVYGNT